MLFLLNLAFIFSGLLLLRYIHQLFFIPDSLASKYLDHPNTWEVKLTDELKSILNDLKAKNKVEGQNNTTTSQG